jgi:hypothetical protein
MARCVLCPVGYGVGNGTESVPIFVLRKARGPFLEMGFANCEAPSKCANMSSEVVEKALALGATPSTYIRCFLTSASKNATKFSKQRLVLL